MITTGGTIEAAVKGLLDAGCKPDISVAATHALCVGPALTRLQELPIRQLFATNSVTRPTVLAQLHIVNLGPMIAGTIARLNRDESLETLLAYA